MNQFLRGLGWLIRRSRKDAELREELEFHLEAEAEERQASGLTSEQARQAARRDLGNVTLLLEDTRATWGWTILEQLGQDLRYAARVMASNRAFTALAALSLALGIGANTAIYSLMESILLRSLPVPNPESLVVMKWRAQGFPSVAKGFSLSTGGTYRDSKGGTVGSVFPYPALALFQRNRDVLAGAFCYFGAGRLNITVRGEAEAIEGQYVSGDYFRGMGVGPAAGRLLLTRDDEAGAAAVAVLSYRYSRQRFGEAAYAVGHRSHVRLKHHDNATRGISRRIPVGACAAEIIFRKDLVHPDVAGLLTRMLSLHSLATFPAAQAAVLHPSAADRSPYGRGDLRTQSQPLRTRPCVSPDSAPLCGDPTRISTPLALVIRRGQVWQRLVGAPCPLLVHRLPLLLRRPPAAEL